MGNSSIGVAVIAAGLAGRARLNGYRQVLIGPDHPSSRAGCRWTLRASVMAERPVRVPGTCLPQANRRPGPASPVPISPTACTICGCSKP